MYPPYRLALRLEQAGHAVWFQASTRSPILLGGAIGYALTFEDNYGEGIDNFLYNARPEQYDQIFACYETPTLPDGHTLPQQTNARVLLFTE